MTTHVSDTLPYAWPYDGRVDGSHLALILLGWDHGWAERVHDIEPFASRCRSLGEAVAGCGGEVISVSHLGASPMALPAARQLGVPALDAFYGSPLDHWLRGASRTHLLIGGLGLEGPVHSSLRSANDRGYECLVVTDACAPCDPATADAAVKTITMSGGIFGAIGTSPAALAALDAAHPPVPPTTDLEEH